MELIELNIQTISKLLKRYTADLKVNLIITAEPIPGFTTTFNLKRLTVEVIEDCIVVVNNGVTIAHINQSPSQLYDIINGFRSLRFTTDGKNDELGVIIDINSDGTYTANKQGSDYILSLTIEEYVKQNEGAITYGREAVPKVLANVIECAFRHDHYVTVVTEVPGVHNSLRPYILTNGNYIVQRFTDTVMEVVEDKGGYSRPLRWDTQANILCNLPEKEFINYKEVEKIPTSIEEIIGESNNGIPSFIYNKVSGELIINNPSYIETLTN